jgi:hypothetical protein
MCVVVSTSPYILTDILSLVGYLTSFQYPDYGAADARMSDDELEISGLGLTKVLSWHWPEVTAENHKELIGGARAPDWILTKHSPNTSRECCCQSNGFCKSKPHEIQTLMYLSHNENVLLLCIKHSEPISCFLRCLCPCTNPNRFK